MAISGQQNINIGVENQVPGSDSLYDAWHKTQNNFTTLFNTSSPYNTFAGGVGISTLSNSTTGLVTITNTGVTSITAGSGVTVSGPSGDIVISVNLDANGNVVAGVTNVAVESSTLNITGGPIVSSGIITVDLPAIPPSPTFAAGEYVAPTLTVDNYGRITAIDNTVSTGTVTSVAVAAVGNGLSVTGSPITSSGIIQIRNTGVTKITAGTGISLSGTTGDITITSTNISDGTVKRIDFSSNALVITGSPVTTTGNITIDLPDDVDVLGNLTVAGEANITGNLTVMGTLYAPDGFSADDATYSGNVIANVITANIEFNGANANLTGNLLVGGVANVTGNINALGNVNVTGNISAAKFTGNVSGNVTGDLSGNVTGDLSGNSTGHFDGIIGNTTANSASFTDVDISGNANITLDANIDGNANVAYNLTVTGNANVTGNIAVGTMGDLLTTHVVTSPYHDANVLTIYGDVGNVSGYLAFVNDSNNYTLMIAPATMANTVYTLPQSDGTAGAFMKTNGSGQLSFSNQLVSSSAPATASSAGSPGQIAFDNGNLYVCVATNTWKKATLTTF
jgi:hypothetical protein